MVIIFPTDETATHVTRVNKKHKIRNINGHEPKLRPNLQEIITTYRRKDTKAFRDRSFNVMYAVYLDQNIVE